MLLFVDDERFAKLNKFQEDAKLPASTTFIPLLNNKISWESSLMTHPFRDVLQGSILTDFWHFTRWSSNFFAGRSTALIDNINKITLPICTLYVWNCHGFSVNGLGYDQRHHWSQQRHSTKHTNEMTIVQVRISYSELKRWVLNPVSIVNVFTTMKQPRVWTALRRLG